jgi:hypothetical protein
MRRSPTDPPRAGEQAGRGATIEPRDADVDARVEQLTRELAEAINDAEAGGRVVMRDYAIDLLRDSVGSEVGDAPVETEKKSAKAPLNPFAMGIPFLLIGAVLTVIFPPVGVALLALGTVTCLIGVVMAMVRSARERWRSADDVR